MRDSISKQDYIKPFQLAHLRTWVRNFNDELYEKILNRVATVKSNVVIPKVPLRTIYPNDLGYSMRLAKEQFLKIEKSKEKTLEQTIENLENRIRGHKGAYTQLKKQIK